MAPKGFEYKIDNLWEDFVKAEPAADGSGCWLMVGDAKNAGVEVRLKRSDLDAIIEKLTALRDGVGE